MWSTQMIHSPTVQCLLFRSVQCSVQCFLFSSVFTLQFTPCPKQFGVILCCILQLILCCILQLIIISITSTFRKKGQEVIIEMSGRYHSTFRSTQFFMLAQKLDWFKSSTNIPARGYDIVADGWAGAYNPLIHTHIRGIWNACFAIFDGPTDGWTDGPSLW